MNIFQSLKNTLNKNYEKDNMNNKSIEQPNQEEVVEKNSKEKYRNEIVKSLRILNIKYDEYFIHKANSYINFDFDEQLDILEKTNRLDTVSSLFWTLLLRNNEIKRKFVKRIFSLLNSFTGKKYLYLSKKFRERESMLWAIKWKDVDIHCFLEDYMTEDEKIIILGLASFHPNGYVREKAIKELSKYTNLKIMPFIIIRACDWVNEVRKEAQGILLNMIQIDNISYIIKNIMLIDKIGENIDGLKTYYRYYDVKVSRLKEDEVFLKKIYIEIDSMLSCSKNKSIITNVLVEAALNKDEYVQEYALSKIITNDLLPKEEIIDITSKVKNQIVSFKLMKLILDRFNDEEVIKFKDDLDKINGSRAKVELIRRLYESGFIKTPEDLKPYALSKYALVRDIARFYMRKYGFKDFFNFYVDILDVIENKKVAVLGMCETCKKEEIDVVLNYFKDSSSKVKKKILNKVILLSNVEPCCNYKIFFEALESECESVVKLSRVYIRQNSELFDKKELYDLYVHTDLISAKSALAEALSCGSGWQSLLYGLKLIGDENKIGYDVGTENIERWIYEKRLYLTREKNTGKVKYYTLSKMNADMAKNFRNIMERNGRFLANDIREIIEGLILNYGQ